MGAAPVALPAGVMVAAAAVPGGLTVRTSAPDGEVFLVAEWLRDQCPCLVCRISQTDERRVLPWAREEASVKDVRVEDGAVHVTWSDDHLSTYDAAWVESVNRSIRRGGYEAHLWRDGHQLSRFDHNEVLGSQDQLLDLFEAFARDGAVVVTGSPTVPGSVIEFVKQINVTLLDSSLGFIFDVKLDPAGYNVAYTSEELPLHNDNAQYAQPPGGQVLAMLVNDASGGSSMVVDGWSVLSQLNSIDPDAVDVLASVDVGFRQYSDEADGFHRSPLVVRDASGRFTHLRFSNQLMQPIEFNHPRLADWYRAYRQLGQLIHDPANQLQFRLTAGDMLMVNGYRILHARKAFQLDGPRHLQDVYFCAQDIFDQLAKMKGLAVDGMVRS